MTYGGRIKVSGGGRPNSPVNQQQPTAKVAKERIKELTSTSRFGIFCCSNRQLEGFQFFLKQHNPRPRDIEEQLRILKTMRADIYDLLMTLANEDNNVVNVYFTIQQLLQECSNSDEDHDTSNIAAILTPEQLKALAWAIRELTSEYRSGFFTSTKGTATSRKVAVQDILNNINYNSPTPTAHKSSSPQRNWPQIRSRSSGLSEDNERKSNTSSLGSSSHIFNNNYNDDDNSEFDENYTTPLSQMPGQQQSQMKTPQEIADHFNSKEFGFTREKLKLNIQITGLQDKINTNTRGTKYPTALNLVNKLLNGQDKITVEQIIQIQKEESNEVANLFNSLALSQPHEAAGYMENILQIIQGATIVETHSKQKIRTESKSNRKSFSKEPQQPKDDPTISKVNSNKDIIQVVTLTNEGARQDENNPNKVNSHRNNSSHSDGKSQKNGTPTTLARTSIEEETVTPSMKPQANRPVPEQSTPAIIDSSSQPKIPEVDANNQGFKIPNPNNHNSQLEGTSSQSQKKPLQKIFRSTSFSSFFPKKGSPSITPESSDNGSSSMNTIISTAESNSSVTNNTINLSTDSEPKLPSSSGLEEKPTPNERNSANSNSMFPPPSGTDSVYDKLNEADINARTETMAAKLRTGDHDPSRLKKRLDWLSKAYPSIFNNLEKAISNEQSQHVAEDNQQAITVLNEMRQKLGKAPKNLIQVDKLRTKIRESLKELHERDNLTQNNKKTFEGNWNREVRHNLPF